MTGAELTAAASSFSVLGLVTLVIMSGCVFAMALGYPWHWPIIAAAVFMILSGNPGGSVLLLGIAVTLRFYAPHIIARLERLDIGRGRSTTQRAREQSHRSSHSASKGQARGRSERDFAFEDLFGKATGKQAAKPAVRPAGSSPETILGLQAGFTLKELDAARRKLAKKFHPDMHRTAPDKIQKQMAEKMRKINAAYETLRSQMA